MGTFCTSDVGERVPWMDMLCRESTRRDAAFYCADEESATNNGYIGEKLDGAGVGKVVRCRSLVSCYFFLNCRFADPTRYTTSP